MQDWLDAYAVSHQNKTNKAIHFICVPLIVFSVVGLFMSIPNGVLKQLSGIASDTIANWAVVTLIPIMFFYLRLSVKMGGINFGLFEFMYLWKCSNSRFYPLWQTSLAIFCCGLDRTILRS